MSLSCMELQLEQWSHTKGKNGTRKNSSDIYLLVERSDQLLKRFHFNFIQSLCGYLPVSPRKSGVGQMGDAGVPDFPGQHFQADLSQLALGSSQRDLFEDSWLPVGVRVYWLKAHFLTLQVRFYI